MADSSREINNPKINDNSNEVTNYPLNINNQQTEWADCRICNRRTYVYVEFFGGICSDCDY